MNITTTITGIENESTNMCCQHNLYLDSSRENSSCISCEVLHRLEIKRSHNWVADLSAGRRTSDVTGTKGMRQTRRQKRKPKPGKMIQQLMSPEGRIGHAPSFFEWRTRWAREEWHEERKKSSSGNCLSPGASGAVSLFPWNCKLIKVLHLILV